MSFKPKFFKVGRGSLVVISCLLFSSAALRLGLETGKAVATENPFLETTLNRSREPAKAPATPSESREELSEMLRSFQEREARIERLEEQIEVKKQALKVANKEIERRLTVLENAEASLRSMLALADTAAEDDLTTLTAVYENMKPKDAAALFEEMEPAFAAGFLGRMRPDAAAGIMAGLSPQAAYSISVILAGRNADVPKG